jgi:hypothetical protein
MPSNYQSKSLRAEQERLTAAEQARHDNLVLLIRAYESVRLTHGPQRDEAERVLGIALSREDRPFCLDGWLWHWSQTEQSIMRHKAISTLHARPNPAR